jgi:flagellar biosynthesis/type III secretory pathway chaperone
MFPNIQSPLQNIELDELDKLRSENIHLRLTSITLRKQQLMAELGRLGQEELTVHKELSDFIGTVQRKYNVTDEALADALQKMGQNQ